MTNSFLEKAVRKLTKVCHDKLFMNIEFTLNRTFIDLMSHIKAAY